MAREDSDQTGQMPRLIRVFAGCTGHFAGYVVLQHLMTLQCKGLNTETGVTCIVWAKIPSVKVLLFLMRWVKFISQTSLTIR